MYTCIMGTMMALLMALAASMAMGRPTSEPEPISVARPKDRQMMEDATVVLSLDAATTDAGQGLTSLEGNEEDTAWTSPADQAMSIQLYNAGYDQAYGGAVVFIPPAEGAAEAGTYGEGKPMGVQDGAWGNEFSALAWYKPAGLAAGANPVLVQVVGLVPEKNDPRASATWRVAGFQDQTSGWEGWGPFALNRTCWSIPIPGFDAQPTYTADSLKDCWVQLGMVKSGPALEFFKNGQSAGTAIASFVVNDYGADALALGVDWSTLTQPDRNASSIDPAALGQPLGWLSGSLGGVEVYSRALTTTEIAAKHDEQSARFAESLCSLEVLSAGMSPPPNEPTGTLPPPDQLIGTFSPPGQPTGTFSPPNQPTGTFSPPGQPTGTLPPPDQHTGTLPPPDQHTGTLPPPDQHTGTLPPPNQPSGTLLPPDQAPDLPSTLDNSTATVEGSGSSGTVKNTLMMTGGEELADVETDPAKHKQLKQAILASLNLPPSYTTANIQINVISVTQEGARRRLQAGKTKVVIEYTLVATPEVPLEMLQKAETNMYLFIRVQAPTIPWWSDSGSIATVCISNTAGDCHPNTPPITPPVVIQDCSANVCFLLDGSKSLMNVDAWNDVVAAASSVMYSISNPAAVFDVFWYSNDVAKIVHATGAEVAANNSVVTTILNTIPDAHGTWMEQAIKACQDVLLNEDTKVSRTIVLITDGKPTDLQPTLAAAEVAKQRGIKMVVVGAGEIDYSTLKALASGPQFLFASTNLDSSQLLAMADLASKGVCREED